MVTDFAYSPRWERPALIEERDVKVCFQSVAMGKLWNNFKKVPAEITVLSSQRMLAASSSKIMAFDMGSIKTPVKYGSAEILPPALHSSLEGLHRGEPTVAFSERQVITP
jgi:hypothetical protein